MLQLAQQGAEQFGAAADDGLQSVLDNPSMTAEQQARTVTEVCGDALGAEAKNFISILAANKRALLVPRVRPRLEQWIRAERDERVKIRGNSANEFTRSTHPRGKRPRPLPPARPTGWRSPPPPWRGPVAPGRIRAQRERRRDFARLRPAPAAALQECRRDE